MESDKDLKVKADKIAEEKVGFFVHFAVYVMVNLFLVVLWWSTGGSWRSFSLVYISSVWMGV